MRSDAVHVVWSYCPNKSSDFQFLPEFNQNICESDDCIGEYELMNVIGTGQFSTVKKGTKKRCNEISSVSLVKEDVDESSSCGSFLTPNKFSSVVSLASPPPLESSMLSNDYEKPIRMNSPSSLSPDSALLGSLSNSLENRKISSSPPVGTVVAIKIIPKEKLTSIDDVRRVERELNALTVLQGMDPNRQFSFQQLPANPHILPINALLHPIGCPNIVRHFETLHAAHNLYIVNEILPMDLFEFMGRYKDKVTTTVAAVLIRELLDGIIYMESKRIAHRDLKPENVLVEVTRNEIVVKICDFNLCAILPENSSILNTFVGSPGFFAPETLLTKSFCALKADVFSFGCIALELLVSSTFFSGVWMAAFTCIQTADAPGFSQAIKKATVAVNQEISRQFTPDITNLMLQSLSLQPLLRANAASIRSNSWLISASKFQAADILNDRTRRKYVDVPSPLLLPRATPGGDISRSNSHVQLDECIKSENQVQFLLPITPPPLLSARTKLPRTSLRKSLKTARSNTEPSGTSEATTTPIIEEEAPERFKLPSTSLSIAASNIAHMHLHNRRGSASTNLTTLNAVSTGSCSKTVDAAAGRAFRILV